MAQTKRFFVKKAFEELGLAAYIYSLGPEEWDSALATMNAMVAEWDGKGARVGGWIMSSDPDGDDLDTKVQVPDANWRCIWLNLALAIAPSVGKSPEGPTIALAKQAYDDLCMKGYVIPEMKRPATMPLGAGWKQTPKNQQWYVEQERLFSGTDGQLKLPDPNSPDAIFPG